MDVIETSCDRQRVAADGCPAVAWERAKGLGTAIEEEPNTDNGTGMRAFVIQDPDGCHVAINEPRAAGAA